MLGRSASGPGGLSINTGGANLFGSGAQTQPQAGGGLFGQTQPAQTGTSLFGNTTATAQPQAAGSLFGGGAATTAQPQQQQQTGGLFGGATNTAQAQQTGGLFGRLATAAQPATTGGLFGATNTQPQALQATGSLFGGQQPQQTLNTTGGLFGGGAAQQQPAQTGGGLFGASTANTSSMFGANKSTLGGGGLLSLTCCPISGLAGTTPGQNQPQQQQQQQQQPQVAGLTMGQSAAKQQVIPGVRIDLSNIRSTTRFNDLQEDLQKELAAIDDKIQSCIRDYEAVEAFLPSHGEQLSAIPTDVSFVTRKSEGAHRALESDVEAISQLRELINRDADNARLSFKAIDNLKLPMQYHQSGLWSKSGVAAGASADANAESNSDLISFFSKTADEMDEMMKKFERNLGEIEVHLHGVQGNMMEQLQRAAAQSGNASQVGVNERAMELAGVLRDFEEGILKVAGVVGGVKEGITELQLKDFMGHGS
ncbi:hypothetical protein QBC35DRAFT_443422 [Podospora australis]|uniref:Nucleoporin n=1 Tax=Podospora australis TaxID=1536484 RepID=A0AAN6WKQ7_9PEZI|nr:hypothetical protein QBC35DRAFT_443422 [Podospora australis]